MAHRASRLSLLILDVVLMVFAALNVVSLRNGADLPGEYKVKPRGLSSSVVRPAAPRAVLRIEGSDARAPELLQYRLAGWTRGDSVTVLETQGGAPAERRIGLAAKYGPVQLWTIVCVGAVFFVFSLYVVIRHSGRPWAGALHGVTVGTALMILYEWGSLTTYPAALTAFCWLMFDLAIWMLPSLFLHFSYLYPMGKRGYKRLILPVFYLASLSGAALSAYYLLQVFVAGVRMEDTPYLLLHAQVNDAFLILGLLCTVANLEHSALTIQNALDRKRVYWVLLGISFGPLVYVFLILVPRTMLDYELVSQAVMQYTLLMAPLMFYLAIRNAPAAVPAADVAVPQ